MRHMLRVGGITLSQGQGTGYDTLTRTSDGGWTKLDRYDQKPISQNTGQEFETLRITGTWFRSDGLRNIQQWRELQSKREPVIVVDGYGYNLGRWKIKKIEEKQSDIIDDGTPLTIGYTLDLQEY